MKKIVVLVILAAIVWQGIEKYQARGSVAAASAAASPAAIASDEEAAVAARGSAESDAGYRCDGRTYCSQMTSCAEATFFLRNCPGVKMDGDHDGIACEQQWCK